MMSRQTSLIAQTRAKKHDQGSTAGSRPAEYDTTNSGRTTFNTPSKQVTTTTSHYVWNSNVGGPVQPAPTGPNLGQYGSAGQSGAPDPNEQPPFQ